MNHDPMCTVLIAGNIRKAIFSWISWFKVDKNFNHDQLSHAHQMNRAVKQTATDHKNITAKSLHC